MAEDAATTPARNACSTISHTATITMQWNGCAAGRIGTENLSHGTLSQHMLQNHLRWQDAIAWPTVNRL